MQKVVTYICDLEYRRGSREKDVEEQMEKKEGLHSELLETPLLRFSFRGNANTFTFKAHFTLGVLTQIERINSIFHSSDFSGFGSV